MPNHDTVPAHERLLGIKIVPRHQTLPVVEQMGRRKTVKQLSCCDFVLPLHDGRTYYLIEDELLEAADSLRALVETGRKDKP